MEYKQEASVCPSETIKPDEVTTLPLPIAISGGRPGYLTLR